MKPKNAVSGQWLLLQEYAGVFTTANIFKIIEKVDRQPTNLEKKLNQKADLSYLIG